LRTLAGPEIAVASTKATVTQYTTLACLTLALAKQRQSISDAELKEMARSLRAIPAVAADILNHDEAILKIAREVAQARDVLYLGRGSQYPIALEGALKLKEICYIHA
ncbi:MAG TPA: glutamine--fructose-6-phosphate aminotransferase, partial [Rhodospirillaceae bacterium]|nr:glutamine--fructose-6-phosphate aminotransferase [Rhodospirillaceae bacterium]